MLLQIIIPKIQQSNNANMIQKREKMKSNNLITSGASKIFSEQYDKLTYGKRENLNEENPVLDFVCVRER